MKIAKFGGTSTANAELLTRVRDIMYQNNRSGLVISACGKDREIPYGATDLLLVLAGEHNKNTQGMSSEQALGYLGKRYSGICQAFGYNDLEKNILGVLQKLPGQDRDFIASRGEFFSASIASRVLGWELIDPTQYIVIDNESTRQPNIEESVKRLSGLKGRRFVFPGFYGSYNGRVMTFNRGGSDLTQALVASGVDATVAENFTDVDGIYYADPRILRNGTKIVPETTYREQRELSAMNSKLNEAAIYPLMIRGIPLQVRSSLNLSSPGTVISSTHKRENGIPIAGVAGRPGNVSMSLYKYRMDEEIGFTRKALSVLEQFKINVHDTPATNDYQGINFRRPENFNEIKDELSLKIQIATGSEVSFIDNNLALVSVVGERMRNTPGLLARVATSLAMANINIETVSQGPSESNIVLGVKDSDYVNAVNAIHDEFVHNGSPHT